MTCICRQTDFDTNVIGCFAAIQRLVIDDDRVLPFSKDSKELYDSVNP